MAWSGSRCRWLQDSVGGVDGIAMSLTAGYHQCRWWDSAGGVGRMASSLAAGYCWWCQWDIVVVGGGIVLVQINHV